MADRENAKTRRPHADQLMKPREFIRSAVDLCRRTGQQLEVRRLDAFEMAALCELRGYDGGMQCSHVRHQTYRLHR